MKRGFTLVELSIVLVIIGLLIGGILVAQSMVSSARLTAFIKQASSFDAAVANFSTKYGTIPGDNSMIIWSTPYFSYNNGVLTSGFGGFWTDEIATFWPELSVSGYMGDENSSAGYQLAPHSTPFDKFPFGGNFAPRSKLGKNAGVFPMGWDHNINVFGSPSTINFYYIADCTATPDDLDSSCIPALTGNEILSVDKKLDDGIGTSGNIEAMSGFSSGSPLIHPYDLAQGTPVAITAGNTLNYIMIMRLGTVTGDLK